MSFKIGDLVWAKMKTYSPWPGYVSRLPTENNKKLHKNKKLWIYFFGTRNEGWVEVSGIQDYEEYKEMYTAMSKSSSFLKACEEIEEYAKKKSLGGIPPPNATPEEDAFDKLMMSTSTPKRDKQDSADTSESKSAPKKPRLSSPAKNSNAKRPSDFEPPEYDSSAHSSPKRDNDDLSGNESSTEEHNAVSTNNISVGTSPSEHCFGVLGVGTYGTEVIKKLISSGHKVSVLCPSDVMDKVAINGVTTCSSVVDLVSSSDIVLSFQPSAQEAKELMYAADGILSQMSPQKAYVEFTPLDPDTSVQFSAEIAVKGGRYLEAQLIGERSDVENSSLVLLAAGDLELFEACQSCFESWCKSGMFLGKAGSACSMRLIVQMLKGLMIAGLTEGMSLASGCELKLDKTFLDLLGHCLFGSVFYVTKANRMITNNYEPELPLVDLQRDLNMAILVGESAIHPTPLTAATNEKLKFLKSFKYYSDRDASIMYLKSK